MNGIVNGIWAQQEKPDFSKSDSITYRLYLEGDWKELVRQGNHALKYGYDYYYLRMRTGIAYFEMKNYRRAARHFKKALEFNMQDPMASEYLYYSMKWSGRTSEAVALAKKFNSQLKDKINYKESLFIESISLDYLHQENPETMHQDDFTTDIDPVENGYQSVTASLDYFGLGMGHRLSPVFSLFHAYSYLNKNNFFLIQDQGLRAYESRQEINQHQYYISGSFTTCKGYLIQPFFHFIRVSYPVVSEISTGQAPNNRIISANASENQFLAGGSLSRSLGCFDLCIGASYAEMNSRQQMQGNFSGTWYPMGNLYLYITSRFTGISEHHSTTSREFRFMYSQKIGFRTFNFLWIEFHGSAGEIMNYHLYNGLVVFNSGDITNKRLGMNFLVPVKANGLMLSFRYNYSGHTSHFRLTGTESTNNPIEYNTHHLTGGLSWKF